MLRTDTEALKIIIMGKNAQATKRMISDAPRD